MNRPILNIYSLSQLVTPVSYLEEPLDKQTERKNRSESPVFQKQNLPSKKIKKSVGVRWDFKESNGAIDFAKDLKKDIFSFDFENKQKKSKKSHIISDPNKLLLSSEKLEVVHQERTDQRENENNLCVSIDIENLLTKVKEQDFNNLLLTK